jgi:flagella basal body P-ring formation protein FlgA
MLLSNRSKKLLFIAFVFLFPLEVWCNVPATDIEIRLEENIPVMGKNIILGDVATIYAKNIHHFKILSDLVVSGMANEEKTKSIPMAYLKSRILEALPKGTEFRLHGPAKLSFRKETLGVSGEEFAQEILRRGKEEGKIPLWVEAEAEPTSNFDALKLAKIQEIKWDPSAEMPRWKGDMVFKVSLPGSSEVVWSKVKIKWFGKTWVAKKQINPWQPIKAEDFEYSRIDLTALREEVLQSEEEFLALVGKSKTKRLVQEGSPLFRAALEKIPDVKMGEALKVVFVSESGIRVSADGATVNPLSVGEEGRAKLRSSKKIVTGRLVSEGIMEVSL